MRQVPRYLLIGNGRVARHFQHYLSLLELPFDTWNRQIPISDLATKLHASTLVLLLVSDKAIDELAKVCMEQAPSVMRIHFSGSVVSNLAFGAHPLMTFNHSLYSLEQYQRIPFIIDDYAPDFLQLLPGLTNPHARLNRSLKAKYHALCVLSGNFSCLLWQKLFTEFESQLNLPAHFAHPYLEQQMQNLKTDYPSALTGPLVRNDSATMQTNLLALVDDPFQAIYQSFVECYQVIKEEPHEYTGFLSIQDPE